LPSRIRASSWAGSGGKPRARTGSAGSGRGCWQRAYGESRKGAQPPTMSPPRQPGQTIPVGQFHGVLTAAEAGKPVRWRGSCRRPRLQPRPGAAWSLGRSAGTCPSWSSTRHNHRRAAGGSARNRARSRRGTGQAAESGSGAVPAQGQIGHLGPGRHGQKAPHRAPPARPKSSFRRLSGLAQGSRKKSIADPAAKRFMVEGKWFKVAHPENKAPARGGQGPARPHPTGICPFQRNIKSVKLALGLPIGFAFPAA